MLFKYNLPYYDNRDFVSIASRYFSIKGSNTKLIILRSRDFNHISVIINVFTLLLENETLKEFGQNSIGSKELDYASISLLCQNFRNEIGSNLLWLGGENSKGEFAKFYNRYIRCIGQRLGEKYQY